MPGVPLHICQASLALTVRSLLQLPSSVCVGRGLAAQLAQPPELVARARVDCCPTAERERAARLGGGAALDRRPRRAADRRSAGHLGVAPGEVEFAAGPHGKPELPGARLRFNLSHSGDRALIALADGRRGRRRRRAHLARARSAVERTLDRRRAGGAARATIATSQLLRIWCRKEALAKAIGGGLGWAPETLRHEPPGGLRADRPRARRGLRRRAGGGRRAADGRSASSRCDGLRRRGW